MLSATDSESPSVSSIRHDRASSKMLQNIPDLMASMAQLDEDSVQRVRKTAEDPPRISVIDLVAAVTGYTSHAAANAVLRLKTTYPEVSSDWCLFRFGGRGQRDTPVTDARGAIELIMVLPGRAAAIARQSAANVVVRYLGGDASLVREIMMNKQIQAQLEPEHPASIFGQSVPASTPYETHRAQLEMAKNARMQALSAAFQLAQAIDSTSQARLRVEAQKAIDDVLLPQGEIADQFVDAAAILRERAHTEDQISRLAGELGKDLKMVAENEEGYSAQSNEQPFGSDRHQVGLYHRVRHASLIEDVLASFKQRSLYARVMTGQPDPVATRRQGLLSSQGRGRNDRSRSNRRVLLE